MKGKKRSENKMGKRSDEMKRGLMNDKESSTRKLNSIMLISFMLAVLACIVLIYASTMNYLSPTPADNSYTASGSKEFNISIDMANLSEVKWNWNGTNGGGII